MKNVTINNRILVGILIAIFPMIGACMSILDVGKVCVFSSVNGTITLNGEPVKGAKVIRRVEDRDGKSKNDETITDENGKFTMPARHERFLNPIQEVYGWQYIDVIHNGETKEIWYFVKGNEGENTEFGESPINLKCELTSEEKIYKSPTNGRRIATICELIDFKGELIE